MKKSILHILFLSIFVPLTFAQSPWTKQKGKAYVQLGLTSLQYNKQHINGNQVDLNADFSDITTQIYTDYGLTNQLEAQLIIPFKIVDYKSKTGGFSNNLSGFGNLGLGLKYKLYDQNWKISFGLQYAANSITKNPSKNLSTGFNANTFLPYLTAGSSYQKWYFFGNVGYGYMDNQYSDFLKFGGELGYNVSQKGHLILVLENKKIISKENAFFNDVNQWASYSDRQSYSAVGLKFNYEFKKDKFGANFAIIGATGIDNAALAPTLNFGLYTKL